MEIDLKNLYCMINKDFEQQLYYEERVGWNPIINNRTPPMTRKLFTHSLLSLQGHPNIYTWLQISRDGCF